MPPISAVFGLVCLIRKSDNWRVHEQLGLYRLKNTLKYCFFFAGYTHKVVLLEVMEAQIFICMFQKVGKL